MNILNLPSAVRTQIWSRCIKPGITASHHGAQRLASGLLSTRASSLGPLSRGYATVHISENDKVFKRPPDEDPSQLRWDEIMDAARKALDQHSKATAAEKNAVLADLQSRVKTRPRNTTKKRNFMRSFLRAKASQDPASAIRQMLRERKSLKSIEEPQVQARSQAVASGGPSEDQTGLEAPEDKAAHGLVAASDTDSALSIAELLERVDSVESEVVDARSIKENLPLPSIKYRARGYPKSLTKDGCNRINGGQARVALYQLCSDAGIRITHSCDYFERQPPAPDTIHQWCCSLKLRIDDGHLSVTAAALAKSKAENAVWLWVLSKCHVSGVLQRLSLLKASAIAELNATKLEAQKAVTPKLEVTNPEVQVYPLLDSIKEKEQYANLTSRLFQASLISTEINNRCQTLNLAHETQINISSEGTDFTCTLNLRIPGIANESSTGRGSSKQTAKKDAWVAMLVKLDASGALSELFSTSATKRKRAESENENDKTPEPLPTDEDIELVDVQEDLIKQEKDGKIEVFNYAAKFGLVPEFDIRSLKRRIRGQAARRKATSVVQVSIKLPEQNIQVNTYGDTTVKAEVAALLAFKRAAEELHTKQVDVSEPSSDFHALSTKTARSFIEYYRKRKGRTFLEFENEGTGYGGKTGTMSQLTLDGVPVGRRVAMQTKKAAEEVAYLTAAIELAHKEPDILADFATDLKQGNLARSLGTHAAVRATVESDALDIMRQTLLEARQAGLPDVRESLTAIETLVGKRRERPRLRTPKAVASEQLLQRLKRFEEDPAAAKLREIRASLPMSQYSSKVLDLVSDHVYSIVVGATGSGKTTQVPQIILDDAIRQGNGGSCDIICTQPRRLAASSVAQRVAVERGEQLQQSVGYQVRGDSKLPQLGGSITYCTTGLLLERLKWDADDVMDNTSHLVIDEVHERDISIDFLLIVLKKAIKVRQAAGRKVPKVILMSATMDTRLFSAYLPNQVDGRLLPCPHLDVPGRTFPVKEKYLGDVLGELLSAHAKEFWHLATLDKDATTGYIESEGAFERGRLDLDQTSTSSGIDWKKTQVLNQEEAASQAVRKEEGLVPVALLVATIAHICRTTADGAILAFLPGLQEITATEELLMQNPVFGVDFANADAFQIHSLHSTVPVEKQRQIFEPSPRGCRKIILSTNIAETSVTVPDVKHVVDLGKLRENRYDHIQRITSLQTVWESNSNARQRAGRAGRVSSGNYYALYSVERRKTMSASGLPELLRADLQETCLSIKAQGFQESVSSFLAAAIEPPPSKAVEVAVENLKAIEALTPDESLTALGAVLAKLPVHPALGKMVLLGIIFRCLDPMIIISSMGTERSLFVSPIGERLQAKRAREDLNVADSDHIALLRGYQELRYYLSHHGQSSAFRRAQERFLHFGAFRAIHQTAKQIEQNLIDAGLLNRSYDMTAESHEFGGRALNRNSNNIDLVKCLLMAGVYPNIGVRGTSVKGPLHRTASEDKVLMHPSSLNAIQGKSTAPLEDQIYAFTTLARSVKGDTLFMRDTSLVPPLAALLFGGRLEARRNFQELIMDDWLPFKTWGNSAYALQLILEFRKAKDRMLNGAFRSLSQPTGKGLADDPIREILAKGLVTLLDANERQSERENWVPEGWGRRNQVSNDRS
ncbi:ATP-dependent DNA/RNA helicase DHX36 [Pseudocercospora fuligena]|uniref:RNA helicase n=1 Tax=Pseudocercospora fuligena TaxID=685502 RepID=A0A8H6R8A5_9PEZI|nr:ATP-dependent DNA/RNA helicase DHX36 [Pseudocercospora fuligena]